MSKEIYSFTDSEINYVKTIKAGKKINSAQGSKVQAIIRERVNPRFNMCVTCGSSVVQHFNALVIWIETFIGCPIEEYNEKKGLQLTAKTFDKNNTLTKSQIEDLGTAKDIIKHVHEQTGVLITLDPKSKKAIVNKAVEIYNGLNGKKAKSTDYSKKTVDQLKTICKEKGVKYHPRNNKETLIKLLTA